MELDAKLKLQAMSVGSLQVGMYVAELDRPWSETPFKFQGFEVLSKSEIDLLSRHCTIVYVDTGHVSTVAGRRSKDPLAAGDDATNLIDTHRLRMLSMLGQEERHEYGRPIAVGRESEAAVSAYTHAQQGLARFDDAMRNSRKPEARHVRGIVQPVIESIARSPDALVRYTCLKKADPTAGDRRIGTAVWLAVLGRHLGVAPALLLDLASGGLLLDLGMERMDRGIKQSTDSFGGRQQLAMRGHVQLGLDIADQISGLTPAVRLMIAEHHERMDGSGYPQALTREHISIEGAIAAVADAFDAMISLALHSPARSTADAIGELNRMSGAECASMVVAQFVQALGLFPCGSIVELNTGEIAIVAEQDERHRLRPLLLVIVDAQGERLRSPRKLNLSHFSAEAAARNALWIVSGHPPSAFGSDLYQYFR